mmetsp:Transcript_30927/g.77837  ORF Transcript_30927/g.77837 Transcript_30927/m.77837 type:complete len:92 (-) Transcript_30927:1354-1629(-)
MTPGLVAPGMPPLVGFGRNSGIVPGLPWRLSLSCSCCDLSSSVLVLLIRLPGAVRTIDPILGAPPPPTRMLAGIDISTAWYIRSSFWRLSV